MRTRTCVYQGVRNVNFSENFANILNELSLAVNPFHVIKWANLNSIFFENNILTYKNTDNQQSLQET